MPTFAVIFISDFNSCNKFNFFRNYADRTVLSTLSLVKHNCDAKVWNPFVTFFAPLVFAQRGYYIETREFWIWSVRFISFISGRGKFIVIYYWMWHTITDSSLPGHSLVFKQRGRREPAHWQLTTSPICRWPSALLPRIHSHGLFLAFFVVSVNTEVSFVNIPPNWLSTPFWRRKIVVNWQENPVCQPKQPTASGLIPARLPATPRHNIAQVDRRYKSIFPHGKNKAKS